MQNNYLYMFLLKYYLNHKRDMYYYQSNLLTSLMHLVYHFESEYHFHN